MQVQSEEEIRRRNAIPMMVYVQPDPSRALRFNGSSSSNVTPGELKGCRIVNAEDGGKTSVSVCEKNRIRGLAQDWLLVTAPNVVNPFVTACNATDLGVPLLLFEVSPLDTVTAGTAAFRAGNFRAEDLRPGVGLGSWSAAFGYHTKALGPGSMAFGSYGAPNTVASDSSTLDPVIISGFAALSLQRGAAKIKSLIQGGVTNSLVDSACQPDPCTQTDANGIQSQGIGSLAGGATDAGTGSKILAGGSGSAVMGLADTGGAMFTQGPASLVLGYATGTAGMISTNSLALGSIAMGVGSNAGSVRTGFSAVGSQAMGFGVSGGIISTGDQAHGSSAQGAAAGLESTVATQLSAIGSSAQGLALTVGQLTTGPNSHGSSVQGFASFGSILTGSESVGSHAAGLVEGGSLDIPSIIQVNDQSFGSEARGAVLGVGSRIEVGQNSSGSSAFGQVLGDGGVVSVGDQSPGSLVVGSAAGGETHSIQSPNSINVGRNSLILINSPNSSAFGQAALVHLPGMEAQSSYLALSGLQGDGQNWKINLTTQQVSACPVLPLGVDQVIPMTTELILFDGTYARLPFQDGSAVVTIDMIGTSSTSGKICFAVRVTAGVYSIIRQELICPLNPPLIDTTFLAVAIGSSGFTVQITQNVNVSAAATSFSFERFAATLYSTMITTLDPFVCG